MYMTKQSNKKGSEGLVMMGQLYADLEEIENLGVDLTDIGAVWDAAEDHGYEHIEMIVSNFPDNYLRLIHA